MTKNDWLKDYEEFVSSEEIPSSKATEKVMTKMKRLLNPNSFVVFVKVLGINFVIGFLSLSVCHQFGLNPFDTERSLDSWFMHLAGHNVCMFLCGVLFISASIFSAGFILSIEEIRALRKNRLLQTISLSFFALAFLFLIGAEIALGIGLIWLLGAIIGGIFATETLWRIKYVSI